MKKSIILTAFGLMTIVASSSGSGYIYFSSYLANINLPLGPTASQFIGGSLIGIPYQAELYYSFGTVSDPVNNTSLSSITSVPTKLTLLPGVSAAYDNSGSATGLFGLGYFDDPNIVIIPGYTSGPITFEVVAFNGSNYGTSVSRGRSGSFTMNSIVNSVINPPSLFGDNGALMPDFFVASVPEPTSLALAGLGGLVSIVCFIARCRHYSYVSGA
jgi:hypothetical protein